MLIINYNNQLRDILKKAIDTLKFDIHHLNAMSEEEAVSRYREALYELEKSEKDKSFRENSILCMFMDAYRLTLYKLKLGLILDDEIIFLQTLLNLKDSNDILAQVSCDIDFFNKIILSGYYYVSYDNLTRHLIDKSLSMEELKKLKSLVPSIIFDIENSNNKVTLSKLINNIEQQVNKNEDLVDEKLLGAVLIKVNGFINNLYKLDKKETSNLLIEMIKLDYASCKYVNSFDERIQLYESLELDDIINKIINNSFLLNGMIEMMFNVYIHKSFKSKIINVDEISKMNIEEFSKKLVLK